jgi:hypothetical protein
MMIHIETDVVKIATSEAVDKFADLFADLDDLAEMLDTTRAEYLLERLLERFDTELVIDVELEDAKLALAA